MEMSGQLHAPAALPRYTFDRRLGWARKRPGRTGEKKESLSSVGNRNSVFQPVAQFL